MVERNLNKWTEGEWKTAPNDLHFNSQTYVVGPSGELICDAFGEEMGEEERKANARLIASSPNLYRSLKKLVVQIGENKDIVCQEVLDEAIDILEELDGD